MTDTQEPTQRQQHGRAITAATAQLYRHASAYALRTVTGVDLSKGKHAVLRILDEQDGVSLARIADKGALDRGNVTRIVSALEKEGYLTREVDPSARHGYQIFLTKEGKRAADQMNQVIDDWNEKLLAHLDDNTLAELADVLTVLSERAEELALSK